MGKELTLIGVIDDSGYELENRVYSWGGAKSNTQSRERKNKNSKKV